MPYSSELCIPPTTASELLNKSIKAYLLTKNTGESSQIWKKGQENGPLLHQQKMRKSSWTRYKEEQERRRERGITCQPWDPRQDVNIRHPQPPSGGMFPCQPAHLPQFLFKVCKLQVLKLVQEVQSKSWNQQQQQQIWFLSNTLTAQHRFWVWLTHWQPSTDFEFD